MCYATNKPAFMGAVLPSDRPVTAADVERLHMMLECCLARQMSKREVVDALAGLGVDARFTSLVWERLEAENPEFFKAYNSQLESLASLEKLCL